MIAFALVVVCALPLLAPQLWMVEKEKQAVREIEADRLSNLVFIYIAEQLYSNEITWDQLTTGLRHDFEIKGWLADQFLYTTYSVQYDFKELRVDVEDLGKSKHLFQLNIYFIPALKTQKSLVFGYKIFVERDLKLGSDKPGADKNNPKPEKPEKEKETK
jgi:hypothetical protein